MWFKAYPNALCLLASRCLRDSHARVVFLMLAMAAPNVYSAKIHCVIPPSTDMLVDTSLLVEGDKGNSKKWFIEGTRFGSFGDEKARVYVSEHYYRVSFETGTNSDQIAVSEELVISRSTGKSTITRTRVRNRVIEKHNEYVGACEIVDKPKF
jgi:hypothetical protein